MKFIVYGTLPHMNEIIEKSKDHWSKYAEMKKYYTDIVAWSARGIPPLKKVNVNINWHVTNKRKDKDGIMAGQKFILDGMVQAGIIKNDGWNHVGSIHHHFFIDKKNPRIVVHLVEI